MWTSGYGVSMSFLGSVLHIKGIKHTRLSPQNTLPCHSFYQVGQLEYLQYRPLCNRNLEDDRGNQ